MRVLGLKLLNSNLCHLEFCRESNLLALQGIGVVFECSESLLIKCHLRLVVSIVGNLLSELRYSTFVLKG